MAKGPTALNSVPHGVGSYHIIHGFLQLQLQCTSVLTILGVAKPPARNSAPLGVGSHNRYTEWRLILSKSMVQTEGPVSDVAMGTAINQFQP